MPDDVDLSSYAKLCDRLLFSWASPHVLKVELNGPRHNAMGMEFWGGMRGAFAQIRKDKRIRAVVICGHGSHFSSGLDLSDAGVFGVLADKGLDVARKALRFRDQVEDMQESFTAMERCPQPVVAAIHGACIGAGIDLITACCVRYCAIDTRFSVREVAIGLCADVGTLQRLPKVVGCQSWVRELSLTGRDFDAEEARCFGLVSKVLPSKEATVAAATELASAIAAHSPVAVVGTKQSLNYSRDVSVAQGLEAVRTWNGFALQTEDIPKVIENKMQRRKAPPAFSKL
ncbi:unnamed protein product [Chrysoparadoxa australica]